MTLFGNRMITDVINDTRVILEYGWSLLQYDCYPHRKRGEAPREGAHERKYRLECGIYGLRKVRATDNTRGWSSRKSAPHRFQGKMVLRTLEFLLLVSNVSMSSLW